MKSMFQRFIKWLKRIFFPPAGTPRWQRVLPYGILGVFTLVAFLGGNYGWEYTNSSEFCGTSCHTMPPEYSAYLASPHARVQCVECHIGRDAFTERFTRKAGDLRHVVLNITKQYEFPIRAHNMRPARDTCENCHFPEKFSDDSLREIRSFRFDEANSQKSIYLLLKTGGGSQREGLGYGIHWHIESEVYYLATDDLEQDIPYVRVINADGSITEYYDIASDFGPEDVAGKELERMDCITCHNRITHDVPHPDEAISQAISKGLISEDLPYVVREAISLLEGDYSDKETAIESMNLLADYYQQNYPSVFQNNQEEIRQAITTLQEIYEQNIFPEQKSGWYTHPDNLGHKTDPGCFRCHEGNHFTQEGEAVRLECNLCHSIPVVKEESDAVTSIELVSGLEPPSHTHTSWMTLHGKAIDATCEGCHVPPAGVELTDLTDKPPVDPDSFCGNEACHGTVWTFTGFDAPQLQEILDWQLYELQNTSPFLQPGVTPTYENTFGILFTSRCTSCHGGDAPFAGIDLSTYAGVLAGGKTGPGIVQNSPETSNIYLRQSAGGHPGQMLDDEIAALKAWIEAGALER